ncbi:MAG: hypothetical protein AWM53_00650 [Candidatus Dichloromethanomonas elyunquensis]|nr:MAG: hypothetical protein AWM53_00650 [Candidatus Dichloromethanomonas elyunquensis]
MDVNRFCTQCGNKIAEQAKFCTNCGAPLEAAVPSVGNAPPQVIPLSPPPPPVPPSPVYGQPYGQQPFGTQQTQQFTGYAQQQSAGAGGFGAAPKTPKAKRGGCLSWIFKTLLKLIVFIGIIIALYSYLSSNGYIKLPFSLPSISDIRLPWSSAPDAKQFVGKWQVVSITSKGTTVDMTKISSQMILELAQASNNSLTGKLSYASDTSTVVTLTLKPVDDSQKYEGTVVSSSAPKDVVKASAEYAAASKELTLIVTSASEGTSTIKLKKI